VYSKPTAFKLASSKLNRSYRLQKWFSVIPFCALNNEKSLKQYGSSSIQTRIYIAQSVCKVGFVILLCLNLERDKRFCQSKTEWDCGLEMFLVYYKKKKLFL
jgi:hypothetical protein